MYSTSPMLTEGGVEICNSAPPDLREGGGGGSPKHDHIK